MTHDRNNIDVAVGKNFSGRSDYLKHRCLNTLGGVYLGEIPSHYISGVSPTVEHEINLFSSRSKPEKQIAVSELISILKFDKLFQNNPFLLSGGEQVLLSILSGILLEPSLFAIDTAIEQLGEEWKMPLFQLILEKCKDTSFLLSDNRIDEYGIAYNSKLPSSNEKDYQYKFLNPHLIELTNGLPSHIVRLDQLEFGYNKKQSVLKSIDLELKPGNIYFLTGINGAGKSTLAKILTGIFKPRQGYIYDNKSKYNPYRYPGNLFGYCFQNPDEQLFSTTVASEILAKHKNETIEYANRREKFLEMFGLSNLREIHPAEVPFVMRKRVALAASLAYERPWYIIDEPTIGQDEFFIEFLVSLFQHLVSLGKGVIIISHSKSFIARFQPKILNLDNGHLKTS